MCVFVCVCVYIYIYIYIYINPLLTLIGAAIVNFSGFS